jgi:DNA integrity scanning protein DisA with diadenylate cyclase activity
MTAADKNAAISRMILSKVADGMSIRQAVDAVLGSGTCASIISDIYDELRK